MRRFRHLRSTLLAVLVPVIGLGACSQGASAVGQPTTAPPVSVTTPPAAPSPTPTSTPTPPPPPAPAVPTLGPAGFGALHLGMTKVEAVGTGLTTGTTTAGKGACGGTGDGYLRGTPNPGGADDLAGRLFFSAQTGRLVAMYAFAGVKTPQGLELGSTHGELIAAYSDWDPLPVPGSATDGRGGAAVPGNPDAHYRIVVSKNKVIQLSLDSNSQDCYE